MLLLIVWLTLYVLKICFPFNWWGYSKKRRAFLPISIVLYGINCSNNFVKATTYLAIPLLQFVTSDTYYSSKVTAWWPLQICITFKKIKVGASQLTTWLVVKQNNIHYFNILVSNHDYSSLDVWWTLSWYQIFIELDRREILVYFSTTK